MDKAQNNEKEKLYVLLASAFDFSRIESYSMSDFVDQASKPYGKMLVEVEDLKEARDLCMKFIKHYELGGSCRTGGEVINSNDRVVAYISYNGRIWDSKDFPNAKEIIL